MVIGFAENPYDEYIYKIRNVTQGFFYKWEFKSIEDAENFVQSRRRPPLRWQRTDELDIHQFVLVDRGACKINLLGVE